MGYVRCRECGQWHNDEYDLCAPCNGLSERHTPIGEDQSGYKYSEDEYGNDDDDDDEF